MAYSDYGGYAYKNGNRVSERSDAVLSPEGIKSTPGQWPGWKLAEGRNGGSFHVILGDGPIFVGMHKQTGISVFRLGDPINPVDILDEKKAGYIVKYGDSMYLDNDAYREKGESCVLNVDDHIIEIHWTEEDDYYQYVKLTQPDGTIWTGFSGYGVGAGLEDCGYGFSTTDRERTLSHIFGKDKE